VLTNAADLPHDRRRGTTKARGRKVAIREARGLYHHAQEERPAWIEIFVDKVFHPRLPSIFWRMGVLRDLHLAPVFFHELGHHIQATHVPDHRETENVADEWGRRFARRFLYRRHWCVFPLFRLLAVLFFPLLRRRVTGDRKDAVRSD
jgi:hypothetical protein